MNTGVEGVKKAIKARLFKNVQKNVMSRLIENRIIVINPSVSDVIDTNEVFRHGEYYLYIAGYERLLSIFQQFGGNIKRIQIVHHNITDNLLRYNIYENIVKVYAQQLTEVRVNANDFSQFLLELSNAGEHFQFRNARKFVFQGFDLGIQFDLNTIFPKLESLVLHSIEDRINTVCLANVENLKEFELDYSSFGSLRKQDLEYIFIKNKYIERLSLEMWSKIDTFRLIERHLKNLTTLIVRNEGTDILDRINKNLSFDMPNLKMLVLRGTYKNCRIIDFVNCFKNVEVAILRPANECDFLRYIGKLMYVKEIITNKFNKNNVHRIMRQLKYWTYSFENEKFTNKEFLVLKRNA